MNRTLPEVVTDILTFKGGLVEDLYNGCKEYVIPESISYQLNIPEHGKLDFTYSNKCKDAIHSTYDSELFRHFGDLFVDKGRVASAEYVTEDIRIEKFKKDVSIAVNIANSTYRIGTTERKLIPYVLVYFRYTALADEKIEGIIPVVTNEMTLSTIDIGKDVFKILDLVSEPKLRQKRVSNETITAINAASSVASFKIRNTLTDFVRSLQRRLNRDIERVSEYYEMMIKETKKKISQKTSDNISGVDKLIEKLDAIDVEKKWKIQDLLSKYNLTVHIEPVAAIRIVIRCAVFWMNILRKTKTRQFPVIYNPIFKHFDPLPCESCFYPHGSRYICDDNFHIVCNECFNKCSNCGKSYCKKCHKRGCPKCKKEKKD